jgi:hypothetical protein
MDKMATEDLESQNTNDGGANGSTLVATTILHPMVRDLAFLAPNKAQKRVLRAGSNWATNDNATRSRRICRQMHAIVAGLRIDLVAVSTVNTANILLLESQEVADFDAAAAHHIVVVVYIQLLLLLLGWRLGSKDLTILGAGMAGLECARQLLEVINSTIKLLPELQDLCIAGYGNTVVLHVDKIPYPICIIPKEEMTMVSKSISTQQPTQYFLPM